MVLAVEPLSVPTFEGSLQRESEEISVGPGLNADFANHLVIGGTRLVLQKE
jgi:hypothetical protein